MTPPVGTVQFQLSATSATASLGGVGLKKKHHRYAENAEVAQRVENCNSAIECILHPPALCGLMAGRIQRINYGEI